MPRAATPQPQPQPTVEQALADVAEGAARLEKWARHLRDKARKALRARGSSGPGPGDVLLSAVQVEHAWRALATNRTRPRATTRDGRPLLSLYDLHDLWTAGPASATRASPTAPRLRARGHSAWLAAQRQTQRRAPAA